MIITALALFVVGIAFMFNGLQMRKNGCSLAQRGDFETKTQRAPKRCGKKATLAVD